MSGLSSREGTGGFTLDFGWLGDVAAARADVHARRGRVRGNTGIAHACCVCTGADHHLWAPVCRMQPAAPCGAPCCEAPCMQCGLAHMCWPQASGTRRCPAEHSRVGRTGDLVCLRRNAAGWSALVPCARVGAQNVHNQALALLHYGMLGACHRPRTAADIASMRAMPCACASHRHAHQRLAHGGSRACA